MADAAGGYIRTPEDTGVGYRLTDGETVVSARALHIYGMELLKKIFPNSTIHIAEDLLLSEDGQGADPTQGGPS